MIFVTLALKSLWNRKLTAFLTIASVALSLALLLSVERTQRSAQEGFTQSVSQVDLLVGARTGPLNLILYTVFNMGNASNNISWESYQDLKKHPTVAWTIPYSLGDGHRGFRVVATDENFYEHYHFRGDKKVELREGQPALGIWDVVIGSDVEAKLKYKMGDPVVVAHGVTRGEAIQMHDDKPFRISGILKPTGTAIDQSLYISLYGMEAIHIDWQTGAAPTKDKAVPQSQITKEKLPIHQITAFFLRTQTRIETLQLQRDINNYKDEPLMAIIPGATLSDLWRGLSQIERVLKVISLMVMAVGLASMVSSLLASLNERRREMAILRAVGAPPSKITFLLVFESGLITVLGILLGLAIELSGFFILESWLEEKFGFYSVGAVVTSTDFIYMGATLLVGILVGLIPALQATRLALKDGLSVRV
jgi:putative ABC transport system permease protein